VTSPGSPAAGNGAPQPEPLPSRYDLIVIAASAGGLEALTAVLSGLPADFPVPIAVVQHRSLELPHMLAEILGRRTALTVTSAIEGESPTAGTVYVAPPGRHLIITPERTFGAIRGELIHFTHSAADPLFLSAAKVYGSRVVAVVLTGGDGDGAAGALAVGLAGGVVIAQDADTSQIFAMPRATIATGQVDAVLAVQDIGPGLIRLIETGSLN
jgi:two-component system chemotaxis response regulator CheB